MNPFVIAFRRIIYSIPLKRLLVGLAVFGVFFASFSNAEKVESLINYINVGNATASNNWLNLQHFDDPGTYCLYFEPTEYYTTYLKWWIDSQPANVFLGVNPNTRGCMTTPNSNTNLYVQKEGYGTINFNFKIYENGRLLNTEIPVYSSMQCQTEYNLIPVESVDQNYCTSNNLCPASSPSDCPNVGVSNLYINDLFHPGAFNIIMNIPEEIDWDYAYTNSGQNFNIDVVGYNQDFEAIEGWIETNNYKPTSEDFTNIFTNFSNFGGLLIGALFVILVFYFVKKIFK